MRRRTRRNRLRLKAAATGLLGGAVGAGLASGLLGPQPLGATAATDPTAPEATAVTAAMAAVTPLAAPSSGLAEPDGSLFTTTGSMPAIAGLAKPVVGWVNRPGGGSWEVSPDGGVFSRGGAPFFGSLGSVRLAAPIVGLAATPSGAGTGWCRATVGCSVSVTPGSSVLRPDSP